MRVTLTLLLLMTLGSAALAAELPTPTQVEADARKAAPDLWHVRAFSQDLTSARSAGGSGHSVHTDTTQIRRELAIACAFGYPALGTCTAILRPL